MANNLLVSLERLRDAFRSMRNYNYRCALPGEPIGIVLEEARAGDYVTVDFSPALSEIPTLFQVHIRDGLGNVLVADNTIPVYQGDRVHRPSPGRQDCPICRELPVPAAPRVSLVETAERLGLLEEPAFRPGGIVQAPEPIHLCGGPAHCLVCADWEAARELAAGQRLRHPLSSMAPAAWVNPGTTFTHMATDGAPLSYTVETAALDAIREAVAVPAGPLDGARDRQRATYRPLEGPTSPCSACDAQVNPAELWVGKRSGIALCDPCMDKWEQAGRARRTGEF